MFKKCLWNIAYEPCHEKTCLLGFQPGQTETGKDSGRRGIEHNLCS